MTLSLGGRPWATLSAAATCDPDPERPAMGDPVLWWPAMCDPVLGWPAMCDPVLWWPAKGDPALPFASDCGPGNLDTLSEHRNTP